MMGSAERSKAADGVSRPQDYGASGEAGQAATAAIQAAIDTAHAAGGGTVFFSRGQYLTGTLTLRSNVHLRLDAGAVILGSTNREDYHRLPATCAETTDQHDHGWQSLHEYAYYGLFIALGARNIRISGAGVIDGQGAEFVRKYDPVYPACKGALAVKHRPVLLHFVECRGVRVEGITLKSPAGWLQCHLHSEDVRIEGVTIESMGAWNNDGIDIVGCCNVIIRGCNINCADDAICLKSTGRAVENVMVADCIVRCSASAFKCGSGSGRGFRNIAVSNLVIYDTARSGIALEVVDGATMELVTISNLTMHNVGNAIFIRLGDRARLGGENSGVGTLRDIIISNITAEITGFDADAAYPFRAPRLDPRPNPLPSSITGLKNARIRNVQLSNINLVYQGEAHDPSRIIPPARCQTVPETESAYPEYDQFGELPAWGLYVRHVEGLILRDVVLQKRGHDPRPAILCDDVVRMRLEGVETPAESGTIVLHDVCEVKAITPAQAGEILFLSSKNGGPPCDQLQSSAKKSAIIPEKI